MGLNQIGYKGADEITPRIDYSQNDGQQYIVADISGRSITLLPGQTFILPVGQWKITSGRATVLQWYDERSVRWRNNGTQPGQMTNCSSDGSNWRLANTTGTPVGALITNVGAGNAANGYNTVGVTVSGGNSTWATFVGGSVNTTVTVTTGGNYSLAPILVWQAAQNQTIPFVPPQFTCNINANGTINTVTCVHQGAGLTATGNITAMQQVGDSNPGGGVLTMNATLTNGGNLTALYPLTQGTGVTSVPTFTFNIGGGMAATAIMNFTVSNLTIGANGANMGVSKTLVIVSANGQVAGTQNVQVVGTDLGVGVARPRMAWLSASTDASGNFPNNSTVIVEDTGLNLQAVPVLATIASNMNGTINSSPVLTAQVAGVTDTSYMQAM